MPQTCVAAIASSTRPVDTCTDEKGKRVCRILVGVDGSNLFVYPYALDLGSTGEVDIVWTTFDPAIKFDNDDGICFRTSQSAADFKDGKATDDANGGNPATSGGGKRHFKVKYKKTMTVAFSHEYQIQVNAGGRPITCHPTINSSGG